MWSLDFIRRKNHEKQGVRGNKWLFFYNFATFARERLPLFIEAHRYPPPTKKTFLYVHRYIRLLQWPRWSRRSKVTPVTNVERQLCRTVYRIGHIASGLAGGGNSHRSATPCGTGETRSRNWVTVHGQKWRNYKKKATYYLALPVFRDSYVL